MNQVGAGYGPRIRYMGSKHALANQVALLCDDDLLDRPLIDLFGGMCSVGGAVAVSGRPAWANDVQEFAALVARCMLASRGVPPDRQKIIRLLAARYRENLHALSERFGPALEVERRIITRDRHKAYLDAYAAWPHAGTDRLISAEVAQLREQRAAFPYRLATLTFAWGYFGLRQSVELDSIRYAIDQAAGDLSSSERDWAILATLQTASRIASAPGHFAQYLSGDSASGFARIAATRKRRAWEAFLDAFETLRPYGTAKWRRTNRVFNEDALRIWKRLDRHKLSRPPIFYADPPYSKEHYSRYYHVLETLTRYDYPESIGRGRYRPDRFRTPFSIKLEVLGAMHQLCDAIASREGKLILSYPSSGLVTRDLGLAMDDVLAEHFRSVKLRIAASTKHSTLGSRHGEASTEVTEYVWTAE